MNDKQDEANQRDDAEQARQRMRRHLNRPRWTWRGRSPRALGLAWLLFGLFALGLASLLYGSPSNIPPLVLLMFGGVGVIGLVQLVTGKPMIEP